MLRSMLALSILFVSGGCGGSDGPELVPAGGSVSHNGAPLPGATVSFLPEQGTMARAVTDPQGKFKLMTGNEDGAPVGKYKVTVYAVEAGTATEVTADPTDPGAYALAYEQAMKQQEQSPPKVLVPTKYTDVVTTPLTYEVKKGDPNQFDIQLME
jgi:hypothetical protein